MKKAILFAKRNFIEMIRDPLLYIFCIGMPLGMIIMFQIINGYSQEKIPTFELKSLIPGVMMFSYSVLMLMSSLLISKDRTSAFLKRLFTSPLKGYDFIIGYIIPFILVGFFQNIICLGAGYIFACLNSTDFISFGSCMLLCLEMFPMMIISIMFGMIFGSFLNDKSAPTICSIFISCSGVLGGALMPVDSMGNFEKAIMYLPFYPSTYLGRVVTSAPHTLVNGNSSYYTFDNQGVLGLMVVLAYLIISIACALISFNRMMKKG